MFRMLSRIAAQRTTLIVRFFELTLLVATSKAFIAAGVDELALGEHFR